jgi:L-alanine-DL-glutamate epimerase-like enolase superfamily enzyme
MTETNIEANVNSHSRPGDLRITDMSIACLRGLPMRTAILRLETNQGLVGYGEIRDGASKTYALMLKSRIVGENPCDIDKIFRKIKQFGYHGRQAGGVCGVEMALFDLAGKAYGVPAYQLLGGKFRDQVLCYCDTPSTNDAKEMGRRLKERMEMGFSFLKMDVGIQLVRDIPGALIAPPDMLQSRNIMHSFTGIQLTDKGIEALSDYVGTVRDIVGYEVPLAADHFGHIGLESCIRLGRALDKYTLAWYEDMIPWQFADQYARLSASVDTPICTGEDIYLKEGFKDLFEKRAIAVCHPDLATSGGLLETKKIGDYAQDNGIAMAMHFAGSPISCLANVHCAAATENFLVLENHSVDLPQWNELITGLPNPLVQNSHIQVPETPGLGFEALNDDMVREFLDPDQPGYFEPTELWDREFSHDRLWS